MKKLRNLVSGLFAKKMVIVSDYAAALGAEHQEPTPEEVENHRYLWTAKKSLAAKYALDDYNFEPIHYEKVTGFAPRITLLDDSFNVQGGLITYNGHYVLFPQRRVNEALNQRLTELVQKDVNRVDEYEFRKTVNHFIHSYGDDAQNGVKNSTYYFQGNPYCLRLDKKNVQDQYQWYRMAPVVGHRKGIHILCDDVLFADHSYNEYKFMDDLRNSTKLKTVPYMQNQTTTKLNNESEKGL